MSRATSTGGAKPGAGDVDAYLAALPEGVRGALQRVRRTIEAAAPEATETISYGMPAFELHGRPLVYFAAFKDHCSLYPATARVLEAHGKELKRYFSGKRTLRFTSDDPIPASLLRRIVKTRIEEMKTPRRDHGRGRRRS